MCFFFLRSSTSEKKCAVFKDTQTHITHVQFQPSYQTQNAGTKNKFAPSDTVEPGSL